jgi:hypothetical protein
MVTQWTEGLYRLFQLCQIVIVAVLFWFGVWIMATLAVGGTKLLPPSCRSRLRNALPRAVTTCSPP